MLAAIGLGAPEIVVLGVLCFGVFMVVALATLAIVLGNMKRNSVQTNMAASARVNSPAPPPIDSAVITAEVVAGITRRFCPQCRAPLAADAPEGLCPACLMAGAIGSSPAAPAIGTAVTTPPSGSQPPVTGEVGDLATRFPQLEILELLGRGGMGAVYKARQKNLDRLVALKVIPPEAAADPAFAERFAREARALARLNHANIVTVHDFGQAGEVYFLVMEYVDGVNLRQAMRAGRLSPREALAIVPQICDALQYAHDQGVVHRDIKPENVLLDRAGRVKIADFGLAKLLATGKDDYTLTRTQQIMGTPRYMAPEQMERPSSVDHRADIYSLGVVIYEMLTGEIPMGKFALPSEKVQVDVRIDQVVLRALEREPEHRYQRASEVKSELASAVTRLTAGGQSPAIAESAAPAWKTPVPAIKSEPTLPQPPGGVPLGMVLGVAIGMVLGVLLMTAGLFGLVFAFTDKVGPGSEAFWGWIGASIGCIGGGFGSWAGSYNTYRQLAGAEDLIRSRRMTWFDWCMRGYLLVGIALIIAGCWDYPDGNPDPISFWPLVLLGGIATFQAGLFLIYRTLMAIPAGQAGPLDPRRESIKRRVAGPAVGLMIVGLLGLTPLIAALIIVPAFVLVPGGEPRPMPKTQEAAPDWKSMRGTKSGAIMTQNSAPFLCWTARSLIGATLPVATMAPLVLAQYSEAPDAHVSFAAGPILGGIFLLFGTIPSCLLIVAGWRMRQLKSYGLATVAAVMAMLPCTIGWILGLPMGIWALVTLLQTDVREAFES